MPLVLDGTAKVVQANIGANVAGTGPAFAAYFNAASQNLNAQTYTTLAFGAETVDTNNCYDTTLYRYQPNVAGWYYVTLTATMQMPSVAGEMIVRVLKNGSVEASWAAMQVFTSNVRQTITTANLIYLNGTTDYIEPMGYLFAAGNVVNANNQARNVFSGFLVRAA